MCAMLMYVPSSCGELSSNPVTLASAGAINLVILCIMIIMFVPFFRLSKQNVKSEVSTEPFNILPEEVELVSVILDWVSTDVESVSDVVGAVVPTDVTFPEFVGVGVSTVELSLLTEVFVDPVAIVVSVMASPVLDGTVDVDGSCVDVDPDAYTEQ